MASDFPFGKVAEPGALTKESVERFFDRISRIMLELSLKVKDGQKHKVIAVVCSVRKILVWEAGDTHVMSLKHEQYEACVVLDVKIAQGQTGPLKATESVHEGDTGVARD